MITSWDIYWITRLDAIIGLLVVLIIIGMVVGILGNVWYVCWIKDYCKKEEESIHWKRVKRIVIADVICILCFCLGLCFIPSTKEFAAIYLIPKIANNEQVKKIPDNAMKLLNGKLEEWISDFGKKEKK